VERQRRRKKEKKDLTSCISSEVHANIEETCREIKGGERERGSEVLIAGGGGGRPAAERKGRGQDLRNRILPCLIGGGQALNRGLNRQNAGFLMQGKKISE